MFRELTKKRRSIRKYKDEKLSKEELKVILEAGLRSPTAKNLKTLHFILIEDKNTLEKLSNYKEMGSKFLAGAGAAIAVLTDKEIGPTTYRQDACIAAIMIQLQAEDLNIGSCWANVNSAKDKNGRDSEEVIKEILEIPSKFNVECVIGLGYKEKELPEKEANDFEKYVHYEKF